MNENDATRTRFSLLEIEDTIAPDPVPREQIAGVDKIESARVKAVAEREMIAQVTGVELSGKAGSDGLFYDEGTKMLDSGVQTALDSRQEWDQLPTATDAASAHAEQISSEQRKDYRGIPLSKVAIDELGHLARANGGLRFTPWAWSQLRAMAPPKATVRNNLNSWLKTSPRAATFRTRDPDPEAKTRELFAAVSDRYAIVDGDQLFREASKALPSETRARVDYDKATTRLSADLTLHNPYEVEDDIAVGRLHRLGLRITTRDDGGERVRIRCYAERIACINCTLIPFELAGIDRVHVGNARNIWRDIRKLTSRSAEIMGEFSSHWEAAHVTRIFDGGTDGAESAFRRLIQGGWIKVKGLSEDTLTERLVNSWSAEPGGSYQAINRAITRSAHSYDWSRDTMEDLEDQAGAMLYQRVHVLNDLGTRV